MGKRFKIRKKKKPTVESLDKRIRDLQAVPELNYKDTYAAAQVVTNTTNLVLLNGLQSGFIVESRLGSQIMMTSVQLRLHVRMPVGTLSAAEYRVLVLVDRQPNQAAFIFSDLFDTTTVTDMTHSPFMHSNSERFRILYDRRGALPIRFNDAIIGAQSDIHVMTIHRKLHLAVKYDDTTNNGDITDITKNALYLVYVGSSAVGGSQPVLTYGTRIYYKDY